MSNRVMNRRGARELTAEEMDWIGAAATGACLMTVCGPTHTLIDDSRCVDL